MNKQIKQVKDVNGKVIKLHDVVRETETHVMYLVDEGSNQSGVHGLGVTNEINGASDWLDVFPDGVLEVVGNAETTYE